MRRTRLIAIILLLGACAEQQGATGTDAQQPGASATEAGPPASFEVGPDRDTTDMVAGCPGMAPEMRPRGSNCFGIFPEQCGADIALEYVGQPVDAVRAQIEAIDPPGGLRIQRVDEAVNDDLRIQRLNIVYDQTGTVIEADCY